MFISYEYYTNEFMGLSVSETDFPILNAWAQNLINQITYNQVTESNITNLPTLIQTNFKNAICAQISYLSLYGLDSMVIGAMSTGFTVGKVKIDNANNNTEKTSAKLNAVSPLAMFYLEQTGLTNPNVIVSRDNYLPIWWY